MRCGISEVCRASNGHAGPCRPDLRTMCTICGSRLRCEFCDKCRAYICEGCEGPYHIDKCAELKELLKDVDASYRRD